MTKKMKLSYSFKGDDKVKHTYIVIVKAGTRIDWGEILRGPRSEKEGYYYTISTELPLEKARQMSGVLHAYDDVAAPFMVIE